MMRNVSCNLDPCSSDVTKDDGRLQAHDPSEHVN